MVLRQATPNAKFSGYFQARDFALKPARELTALSRPRVAGGEKGRCPLHNPELPARSWVTQQPSGP